MSIPPDVAISSFGTSFHFLQSLSWEVVMWTAAVDIQTFKKTTKIKPTLALLWGFNPEKIKMLAWRLQDKCV